MICGRPCQHRTACTGSASCMHMLDWSKQQLRGCTVVPQAVHCTVRQADCAGGHCAVLAVVTGRAWCRPLSESCPLCSCPVQLTWPSCRNNAGCHCVLHRTGSAGRHNGMHLQVCASITRFSCRVALRNAANLKLEAGECHDRGCRAGAVIKN